MRSSRRSARGWYYSILLLSVLHICGKSLSIVSSNIKTKMQSFISASSVACLAFIISATSTAALPLTPQTQNVDQAPQYVISATSGPEGPGCNNDIIDSMTWKDKSNTNGCVSLDSPAYCLSWNSTLAYKEVQVFENHGCRNGGHPQVWKSQVDGKVVLQSGTPIYSFLVGPPKEKRASSNAKLDR